VVKWLLLALALCTGCSMILGFEEGKPLPEKDAPEAGCDACVPPGDTLTTFVGRPRAMTTLGDYLYYTSEDRVLACAKTGCADGGTPISDPGVFPNGVVRIRDVLAWADTTQVRLCRVNGDERCATTINVGAPGVLALAPDEDENTALWIQRSPDGNASVVTAWELGGTPHSVAEIPNWSNNAALAVAGEDRYFVLLDGDLRSITAGTDTPITDPLHKNGGVPGLTVAGDRLIWILDREDHASLFQCTIEEAPSAPPALCNPGRIGEFAAAPGGEHVTALVAAGDVVYWAELGAEGTGIQSCPLTHGGSAVDPPLPCASTNRRFLGSFPDRAIALTLDETYIYALTTDVHAAGSAAASAIRRIRR
jgi:hypothetical protein